MIVSEKKDEIQNKYRNREPHSPALGGAIPHTSPGFARQRRALLLILALSVLLRLAVALYLGDEVQPLPGIHDQLSYDQLAQSILEGKGYQFDLAWYPFTRPHTPTAHWSFLYPLYLAGIYGAVGYHPIVARLLQALAAGLLTPLLVYRLGNRWFGECPGLVAALWVALYGYFVYHNAALMTESFYILAVLWALDLAYGMLDSGRDERWWLLGLAMGTAVLLRQVYLFFVPVLLLWLAWAGRGTLSRKRLVLALGLAGAVIFPWTVRNYVTYGQFLLLNSNSGYAFYNANHPAHGDAWDPDLVVPVPTEMAAANEAKLDRALMAQGIAFVLDDPLRYFNLILTRIAYHVRFWPTPGWRLISNATRVESLGLALPFMLAGLVLSLRDWRRLLPVYLFAAMFVALHVLSWPGPRYRFPVDALLLVFAGFAACRFWAWLRRALRNRQASPAVELANPDGS